MNLLKSLPNPLPYLRWRRGKSTQAETKEEQQEQPKKPNVLLVGRTGVGKSALINAVFGDDVAKSGHGLPITQGFTCYSADHVPINVYDSAGWEGGTEKDAEFSKSLNQFLKKHDINAVWYAVDAVGARFTDFDVKLHQKTFKKYTTVIVLTKCDIASDEQIIDILRAIAVANVPVEEILQVSASPIMDLHEGEQKRFSPQEIVQKTLELLENTK